MSVSESKSAKIIFWWQFSDLVDRQTVFSSFTGSRDSKEEEGL
jgi:hypothetical protein